MYEVGGSGGVARTIAGEVVVVLVVNQIREIATATTLQGLTGRASQIAGLGDVSRWKSGVKMGRLAPSRNIIFGGAKGKV